MKRPFIGKHIKIIDAKNKSNIGLEGVVIDETKNTFVIKNKEKQTIIKENVTIMVDNKTIEGKKLTKNLKRGSKDEGNNRNKGYQSTCK